ncbi:hypothetical protein SPF06_18985 [Sinomonas sp. JGH33]|uniref:Uncharacterized protein n=1 Tax=Sinomonas terricola TaxID=3110330 RepID=A0ABU5TAV3_9MICC|nr:hypothetical protein [Sinomonas sp. JGH33]MEA5456813.1 hypothetical protein [Sinomonas sp. JGH33]
MTSDELGEDMAELADAATSFAVSGEVCDRLVRLHADPFDASARDALSAYLASDRYLTGVAAAARIRAGRASAPACLVVRAGEA